MIEKKSVWPINLFYIFILKSITTFLASSLSSSRLYTSASGMLSSSFGDVAIFQKALFIFKITSETN